MSVLVAIGWLLITCSLVFTGIVAVWLAYSLLWGSGSLSVTAGKRTWERRWNRTKKHFRENGSREG